MTAGPHKGKGSAGPEKEKDAPVVQPAKLFNAVKHEAKELACELLAVCRWHALKHLNHLVEEKGHRAKGDGDTREGAARVDE